MWFSEQHYPHDTMPRKRKCNEDAEGRVKKRPKRAQENLELQPIPQLNPEPELAFGLEIGFELNAQSQPQPPSPQLGLPIAPAQQIPAVPDQTPTSQHKIQEHPMPGQQAVVEVEYIADELLDLPPPNDDDVFVALGDPYKILDSPTFTPAKTLPMYDSQKIYSECQHVLSAFEFRSRWLYNHLTAGVAVIRKVNVFQSEDQYQRAVDKLITQRLRHAWNEEGWIQNLRRSRDFTDEQNRMYGELCRSAPDRACIQSILCSLCNEALRRRYGELVNLQDPVVRRNFQRNCQVEAIRWYLRIIREWTFEAWSDWEETQFKENMTYLSAGGIPKKMAVSRSGCYAW